MQRYKRCSKRKKRYQRTSHARIHQLPSPQPSLVPLNGVLVRMNSRSGIDGSTPLEATSYRRPFSANTSRSTMIPFPAAVSMSDRWSPSALAALAVEDQQHGNQHMSLPLSGWQGGVGLALSVCVCLRSERASEKRWS
jgi:hypothetical protein